MWTFFSVVDGEVTGSQHHQPSGSFRSRVFMLVGSTPSLIVSFSFLVRVSVPSKQLDNIVSLEGESGDLAPRLRLLFPEYSSLLSLPPSLVKHCLNLPFGTPRGWNEGCFL